MVCYCIWIPWDGLINLSGIRNWLMKLILCLSSTQKDGLLLYLDTCDEYPSLATLFKENNINLFTTRQSLKTKKY